MRKVVASVAAAADALADSACAGLTVICATNDPFLIARADEELALRA